MPAKAVDEQLNQWSISPKLTIPKIIWRYSPVSVVSSAPR